MKSKLKYIKGILLAGLVFFLFSFAEKRNSSRKINSVELSFTDTENLYITEAAVNKLLIVNNVEAQKQGKETLDLNEVEVLLNSHDMIENAEVFMSIDGNLGASITQKKPIARILNATSYYLDRQGRKMPLSDFHSARVPLVYGVTAEQHQEVFPLLDFIAKDEVLSRQIIGIKRNPGGIYELQVREFDYSISFGEAEHLDRKFNNYKAFFKQAMEDNKLETYKEVNLQFGNQVVCTKK